MTLAPYRREHEAATVRRMERGRMPRTLSGLLHWYTQALALELPDRTHKREVWRDSVSTHELEQGTQPTGGSHLGTPAWSGLFRAFIEGSESRTDEDGYYLFPVRSALCRLSRRWPATASYLFRVGMSEGDWRTTATALGYSLEIMEVFTEEALRKLWLQHYDRTTKGVA